MQRRLRIALAVTAAAGALALGAGTAFADAPTDGINGANTPNLGSNSADPLSGVTSSIGSPAQTSGADSNDADSDNADSDAPNTDAATNAPTSGLMSNGGNVGTPSLTGATK
ncbi:MAG TPA: hypothetical protein VH008_21715 [Pseudonocardia sp.]|jgi:hypothetical protein|nr:hypothetical protein [Pseudonocardia sp.]